MLKYIAVLTIIVAMLVAGCARPACPRAGRSRGSANPGCGARCRFSLPRPRLPRSRRACRVDHGVLAHG